MISAASQFQLPPDFQSFDARAAFRNYERSLPHWRQPGASYFLTFRLLDSLPAAVMGEIRNEQAAWESRIEAERRLHDGELTAGTAEDYDAFLVRRCRRLEALMDEGHGSCLLKHPEIRGPVVDALLHFHHERYVMHGLVVMPNHVHLAVQPLGEWQPENLLHSWKRFSARAINRRLGREGQLWQQDTWNRIIRNAEHWHKVMRYIVSNPTRAKCWNSDSTVWVDACLVATSSSVREETLEEPW